MKKRNAAAKAFFAEFDSDPVRRAQILIDRRLCRESRRVYNSSLNPYVDSEVLKEPKPEPVGDDVGPMEFMYRA